MAECIAGCGLAAEAGAVYCQGCREGADRDRELAVFETSHDGGLT
ncbi:hypothetical protein [Haloactinomyces albus]|uniref:Uncharacterized protein n=1 Tax=Haloactinomyces albus TaxID=1352928 RepID=A0AAE4CLZ7_9ACTN|nr:hypothetical protein [Haloactinomyces albus]MDR7302770.1 hypothetical protein [Haloactinomyces albus]